MLRMPSFSVHQPETLAEAVRLKNELPSALYVAGGTDLLPNLKQGLHTPSDLISLGRLPLKGITTRDDGTVVIGAGTPLAEVAVAAVPPGLAQAAGSVAGPQHRRMGTLGGNVMLDTRCLFYNQTEQWREALGYCLKKTGDWCHVIGSPKTCVAAHSADTVPVLIALGALLHFETADGPLTVEIGKLYKQDGRYETNRLVPASALLHTIEIPATGDGHRSVYRKVRSRDAVDFPQLGVALVATFDGRTVTALRGVVSAVMPKPKELRHMDKAVGTELDDATIEVLAEHAYRQVKPQTQIHGSQAWRRHMARVEVRRGLQALRGDQSRASSS